MKKTKKAFTLIELLVCMLVSAMLFVMLFSLLARTTDMYNKITSDGDQGYAVVMIGDIEILSRGCDYVTVSSDAGAVIFHDNGEKYVIDSDDYGVEAIVTVDNSNHVISINIGGEVYCVRYVLNTPS